MTQQQTARRTEPLVPVDHPDYRWTPLADVQATWRRYGWVPLAEQKLSSKDNNGYCATSQA